MSRRNRKKLITLGLGLIGLAIGALQQHNIVAPIATLAEKNQPGLYTVIEFTDGDTITVNMDGTKEKVRFIGVDTPETHDPRKTVQCFGLAAASFTKTTIGTNKVRLEADPQNTNRDRYSRLLRYVYLPDGRLVNAEIIKQGYGFAYTSFPFEKLEEFKSYQTEAQAKKLGLWGSCQPELNKYGGYTSNDAN
ncbi:MAG TPA: thermonuclease family protein [Candidatus Saccharibacteria bacterium]|nr:thermonuclease family protein [Candidatus Saccharibacteria bacterium]